MFDFSAIDSLKKFSPDCIFIVDNTWLSSALFNPFSHGADYVVVSLTKYYSGGTCIGGCVLGTDQRMKPVIKYATMTGVHYSPVQCETILASLPTLNNRIQRHSSATLGVAQWLEKQKSSVNRVMYPLLESHPSYKINVKYLTQGGPGCIYLHVSVNKKPAKQWVESWVNQSASQLVFETSFGDSKSKIDPWPALDVSDYYDKAKGQGVPGTWIRLAVGHTAETDILIKELESMLKQLPKS